MTDTIPDTMDTKPTPPTPNNPISSKFQFLKFSPRFKSPPRAGPPSLRAHGKQGGHPAEAIVPPRMRRAAFNGQRMRHGDKRAAHGGKNVGAGRRAQQLHEPQRTRRQYAKARQRGTRAPGGTWSTGAPRHGERDEHRARPGRALARTDRSRKLNLKI